MGEQNQTPAVAPEVQALVDAVSSAVRTALADLNTVAQRKTPVGQDPETHRVEVRTVADDRPVEKGIRMARAVRALALSKGDRQKAAYHAEHFLRDSSVARALSEGTNSAGGYLVPPEYSRELIELLRAQTIIRKSGARAIPMNSNVLNVPRLNTGGTSTYVGEASNISPTNQEFGQLTLTAKKLATLTVMSNELLADSSPSVDAIVRDDLVQSMSLKEDITFLRATGSATTPTGLLNLVDTGNKFSANATVNVANIIADMGKARRLVLAANTPMVKPCWYISPRTEGHLMTLADTSTGGWTFRAEMLTGKLFGYPFYVTSQIPENLGAGTDESEIYFGDAAQLIIGENEDLAIDVSSEAAYHDGSNVQAAFSLDQTVIRVIARHDFNIRHDTSFAVIQAVKWGA